MIPRFSGAVLALVPVAVMYTIGGPAGELGALLFLGVSLVVTAARSDSSCEVLVLPSVLLGRRTHLPCLVLSPVDWVEARIRGLSQSAGP